MLKAQDRVKVAKRNLLQVRQALGPTTAGRVMSPVPTEEGIARTVQTVTDNANAKLVEIVKWDLVGVTAATQLLPIAKTEQRTPSGLWVTTLRVSGRYMSLVRFVAFAAEVRHGGAALREMHVANSNFDILIDVFGTCPGCSYDN